MNLQATKLRVATAKMLGVEPDELDDNDALVWLTYMMACGGGSVTFCMTEGGDIGLFLGNEKKAYAIGDIAQDAIRMAAKKMGMPLEKVQP